MHLAALSILLVATVLTTASEPVRRPLRQTIPAGVEQEWVSTLRMVHQHPRRLDRIEMPMAHARELARAYPHHRLAAKTSEIAAYILYLQNRFAEGTREFVVTKRLALEAGDRQTAATAANALSNIYLSAGNIAGALEAAQQAVSTVPASTPASARITFQTNYARMLARGGHFAQAETVFTQVIETAEREGLPALRADAWKFVGRELALRGDLDAAERAVHESLRMRHLNRDPEMASDYHDLADLRMRAGRPAEALRLLEHADGRIATATRFPAWRLDLLRGRARLALGDSRVALEDLRRAVREIDSSPAYLLPGDLLRSQSNRPTEAHEFFVEAALEEFQRTADHRLVQEAFTVSETARAVALRSASAGPPVPPAMAGRYWSAVADLDEANANLLAHRDVESRRRVSQVRLALAELEAGFDRGSDSPASISPSLPRLEERESLIAFQLGERTSLVWTLSGKQLDVTRLPSRAALQQQIRDWLATPAGPEKVGRARELYRVLFGALPAAVHAAPLWLLAVDGELFQTPLAALVTGFKSMRPVYLAELHALQLVPGSWALERRQPGVHSGPFLGIGDPIYNEADPRRAAGWTWTERRAPNSGLTRLAGSEAELRACARLWPSAATLLLGARATPEEFSRELAKSPAVVHMALHVVPAPGDLNENLVALGVGQEGRPAYVGPEWIGAHRLPGSLVVMNGCRSGSGLVSAGEGLMGLTRAWLRAGASRVLSTYWPTLDDGGALAGEFYRQLVEARASPAEALRRAQVAMIAQPDWRADPQYWAAYFLIGYPDRP